DRNVTGVQTCALPISPRTGTLSIGGQNFTITQDAAVSCTYAVSPTTAGPGSAATSGNLTVTAGAGCAWTPTSNAGWLTCTPANRSEERRVGKECRAQW